MIIVYQFPMYARLEPRTHPFNGGRITNTDLLTLDKAAKCASTHAGTEIAPGDFLLAAARGEIALRAIVHREARLQKYDGGIFCNQGMPTENTVPKGAIPTLPLSACQQLANAGRASWRTVDDFEHQDGVLMRFTVATLLENEPDFETVPTDCRVMGYDVHALADAFIDWPAAPSGSPVVTPDDGKAVERLPDDELAELFDPVKVAALEAMFPDSGRWAGYAERAKRNGLSAAKAGRSLFNPYRAVVWWFNQGHHGWKWERCLRVLANNLPARSMDSKHLLTGEFD